MQLTQQAIDNFFDRKKVAVFGVSRSGKKFGNSIYDELKKKEYTVYPINPNGGSYNGEELYGGIDALPEQVESAIVVVPKESSQQVVKQLVEAGIKHVWVQQGSFDKKADYVTSEDVNLIGGECVFMHLQPVQSIHAFHRLINKIFGKLPA